MAARSTNIAPAIKAVIFLSLLCPLSVDGACAISLCVPCVLVVGVSAGCLLPRLMGVACAVGVGVVFVCCAGIVVGVAVLPGVGVAVLPGAGEGEGVTVDAGVGVTGVA
jgi:hypothetical protein